MKGDEELVEPGSTIHHDKRWKYKMIINGFGALCTFTVMIVFGVTKFKDGAWIIVLLIPLLVSGFFSIHHHYKSLAKKLSLENFNSAPRVKRHRVIVLIAGVHRGSLAALSYAQTLGDDITAVHVSIDPQESEKVRAKWDVFGDGTRLVILESPYRLLVEPVLDYIKKLSDIRQPNEMLTIVVPQFIPAHWWENFLHNQTALLLRFALIFKPGLVIVEVPYQV
ncbi:hypothetical protein EG832_08410 [bacterium]|nr:hypothetical protein [bacterium]